MSEIIRGAVATYNRVDNIQPEEWEKKITQILPYGQTPITAILDNMSKTKTDSRILHWWDEEEPALTGDILGIYTDAGMTTPISGTYPEDTVLYVKVNETSAKQILVNNTLGIIAKPNSSGIVSNTSIVRADVKGVLIDGNNSRINIKLLSDMPDFGSAELAWFLSGNAQEEGSELPESVYYEPTEYQNQTQIFMGSCEMTNSALKEMERVEPDKWERTISQALVRLRKDMERNVIFGVMKTSYVNGKQKRHLKGLYQAISAYNNIFDIKKYGTIDSGFAGKSWANVGFDLIDDIVLRTSQTKTDSNAKMLFTGSKGFQAISQVVRNSSQLAYNWSAIEETFGFRVHKIVSCVKDLNIVIHPLFNEIPRFQRAGLLIEGRYISKAVFRDLMFISGKQGNDENGYDWVDGKKAGWLTEFTLKWNYLQNFAWLENLGSDVDAS